MKMNFQTDRIYRFRGAIIMDFRSKYVQLGLTRYYNISLQKLLLVSCFFWLLRFKYLLKYKHKRERKTEIIRGLPAPNTTTL